MIALQRRIGRLERAVVPIAVHVEMESVYAHIRSAIAAKGIIQGRDDSMATCWARSLGYTSSELVQALRERAGI